MAYDPNLLHPAFRPLLGQVIAAAAARGITLVPVQGARTHDEQAHLYAQGRTAPGSIVTNAGPGQSLHNYGVAVDLVPQQLLDTPNWSPESPLWNVVGGLASQFGLEWGGNWTGFVDRPHVQMPVDGGWRALQALPTDAAGFVVLPNGSLAHDLGHGATPVPAGAVSGPQPAGNGAPGAVTAPSPAPERQPTPLADAILSVGNAIQPAAAENRPEPPRTPRLGAADFVENSRNRLAEMQSTFLPPAEPAVGQPQQPFSPFAQPLEAARGPDSAFRMMFGPAKSAPLSGGMRIRA